MSGNEDEQAQKIEYFQKHVIPWLVGHLSMRSTGLQVFTAIQGGLMIAWGTRPNWSLPLLGLASCLSCLLWDSRNRFIFSQLHKLGEETVDRVVFGVGSDGYANNGIHRMSVDTLSDSGRYNPFRLRTIASHTWAIRIVIVVSTIVWILLVVMFCLS
jgi:hypothetical protein